MHPKVFMRSLEEQLRRVKLQYNEASTSNHFYDLSPDELLGNARTWFLRTLQNTDLVYEEMTLSPVEYLEDESLARQKVSPYGLLYPSIVWMITLLEKEQVESIFGLNFYRRIMQAGTSINAKANNNALFSIKRG